MENLVSGVSLSYHQLGKVRFGFNSGEMKWSVTLDYRMRSATFFIYTEPHIELLTLGNVLEDLFTKTIIDGCGYVEFCEMFEYKRNRKSEDLFNDWIGIVNNLKYVFGEEYSLLKVSV